MLYLERCTPWAGLSNAEKDHIANVAQAGGELTALYTNAAKRVIDGLADKGLVTVVWREMNSKVLTDGTVTLREAGWR